MISVLYVDDEADLLELGKLFLEQDGVFAVTTIESGNRALELLREITFDAIVSDFQMPEMDGISLLHQIRSTTDTPFILFTGKGREEVVIEAINNGADFYLQKGGDPAAQFAELGHKIVQAVSRRKAEHALHARLDLIRQTSIASTRFIRLPADQIDAAINQLLADIGVQAHADHCYIAQPTATSAGVTWTHEWICPGTTSLKNQLEDLNSLDFSWTSKRILEFETVNVPNIAALPDQPDEAKKFKGWLLALGLKSFLVIPLTNGPVVMGSLGIGTTKHEVVWPDEDVDILKIYGQIISGALARKAADKAIHESEQLYRTVFEATGTGMMILEEDKTISVVNRELERISGFSRTEIEGKIPWTRFVSPGDVERMKQYHELRRKNPSRVPKNYEFGFLARDGNIINTYITVEMIPGTKKSVVSLIDISREKMAQREMEESEEKFRGLAESLPESIYMIQGNRFVYINPAFSQLFGYSAVYLKAMPDFTEVFFPDDRLRLKKAVAERLAGLRDSERYTVRGIRQDGTVISLAIHGSKTRYKGGIAIIGTITEIRDQ
jgi:PAS domain S-box-containing protein